MMVFLTVGMVAIVGAARGQPDATALRMACRIGVLVFALWRGSIWWGDDAATIQPEALQAARDFGVGERPDHMEFAITDPGWLQLRKLDDLVPDHGHLMHLFLVAWPGMDRVFHLHPDQTAPGYFATSLPTVPARDISHLWRHRA